MPHLSVFVAVANAVHEKLAGFCLKDCFEIGHDHKQGLKLTMDSQTQIPGMMVSSPNSTEE